MAAEDYIDIYWAGDPREATEDDLPLYRLGETVDAPGGQGIVVWLGWSRISIANRYGVRIGSGVSFYDENELTAVETAGENK